MCQSHMFVPTMFEFCAESAALLDAFERRFHGANFPVAPYPFLIVIF